MLYQGKILDGVNRYRACRLMKREPWTIEFNQELVKRTPEEYVMAANVGPSSDARSTGGHRGRVGRAVEADWAEGRSNTFVARVKTGAQGGRPKTRR